MSSNHLTLKIAGIRIGIRPLSEGLEAFCADYLVDEGADFILGATPADIAEERARVAQLFGDSESSELELEKLWLYRQIAETVPAYDVFLVHATSVCLDNDAYLFLGPSGTGKTTHARLWERHFGERMKVINDDKPMLKITDEGVMVCGSPWCGKEGWHNNISAPLKVIFCLHQAEENCIRPLGRSESWEHVINQMYRSRSPATMRKALLFADKLISTTPLYSLNCNNSEEAVRVAYGVVSD